MSSTRVIRLACIALVGLAVGCGEEQPSPDKPTQGGGTQSDLPAAADSPDLVAAKEKWFEEIKASQSSLSECLVIANKISNEAQRKTAKDACEATWRERRARNDAEYELAKRQAGKPK